MLFGNLSSSFLSNFAFGMFDVCTAKQVFLLKSHAEQILFMTEVIMIIK